MPRFRWRSVAFALGATSLLQVPVAVQAQSNPAGNVHVVQPGDTLSQIALDAGADPGAIAALNGIDNPNALSVGQSLKLGGDGGSTAHASAASYSVAAGDTLSSIGQRFNVGTDALVQLNHLDDPNHLAVGTVLTLPSGAAPTASSRATPQAAPAAQSAPAPQDAPGAQSAPAAQAQPQGRSLQVSYTVQAGETLTGIAHQFNVPADAIVQASSLDDPNKLTAGAVLKVPVAARQHAVSDGETLRDIAASEKVDLGSLIDFNQLDDPELIRVGQVLLVPLPAAGQQAASVSSAAAPAATASQTPPPSPPAATAAASPPAATAQPTPTPAPTPKPAATAAQPAPPTTPTPATKPASSPAPRAPIAVLAPPPGAPTDGLPGAGLKLLGSAYVWGGASPSGFDCSGFVWYIARQVGKSISRGMFAQYNAGSHPARDQLQPGDLVFFQNTFAAGLSHDGIYIGNNQFVHAADEAAGVTISSLNTAYWSGHWFGATRLP